MRIRTIKPEFWANPDLASLSYFARLLALGLLNYADDEGYYWADAAMIRGSVFPFEKDALMVSESLSQLVKIGFTTLHNSRNGRIYGTVVNFKKHQKISHPSPSKLKEWIDINEGSLSFPGGFHPGTGNREQGTGNREDPAGGLFSEVDKPKPGPVKSQVQRRTELLFNRRATTPWSKAETDAWRKALAIVEQTTPAEWEALEKWYALPNPPPPAPPLYRRQNLDTLLNHWTAEISKAIRYIPTPSSGKIYDTQLRKYVDV